MSTKKIQNIDIESIIHRVISYCEFSEVAQLIEMLGISPQSFYAMKKRGTLAVNIFVWAFNEKIDLDWLFYGIGSPKAVSKLVDPDFSKADDRNADLYTLLLDFSKRDNTGFIKLQDHIKSFISGRDSLRDEIRDSKAG